MTIRTNTVRAQDHPFFLSELSLVYTTVIGRNGKPCQTSYTLRPENLEPLRERLRVLQTFWRSFECNKRPRPPQWTQQQRDQCRYYREEIADVRNSIHAIETGQGGEVDPDARVSLPEDAGLGTATVAGPALTTGGNGVVDWLMMGLAAVGAAIAAPEISIPRAVAAGWRAVTAAGAL